MERISYIKQMLAELSQVARAERADLLAYLLEMAFTEAADLLSGSAPMNSRQVNRNETARMAVKPSGQV